MTEPTRDVEDAEIEVDRLTQHYGSRPVLEEVSLTVRRGECVAVLGPNASGKTTLLETIGGLLHPMGGEVRIGGLVRRRTVDEELAIRNRCVYLPVDAWMPAGMTVRDFLIGGGRLYEMPFDDDGDGLFARVEAVADLFHLSAVLDSPGSALSTGQGRKVQLAAALLPQSPTLVLDEPFSGGLDPAGIVALKSVLRHLTRDEGRTALFSIPVPELLDGLADRVIVLQGTGIGLDATPAEIMARSGRDTLGEALTDVAFGDAGESVARYFARTDGERADGGRVDTEQPR